MSSVANSEKLFRVGFAFFEQASEKFWDKTVYWRKAMGVWPEVFDKSSVKWWHHLNIKNLDL